MMSASSLCCLLTVISLYVVSVRSDCSSHPPSIANTTQNLTASTPFLEGTVVILTCNDGYMLETNTFLYTCSNSQWSVEGEIVCSEIFCGHVETPDGGTVVNSPTYEVGSFLRFDCHEGFEMTGTSSLLCRIDGEWNPRSAPTCTVRDCGDFGDVLNGETFQDNTYVERNKFGSIVEVTCDRGYVLNGEPEVKCQSNGQWEPKPSCLQTSCEPYPGLNDSRCVRNFRYSNNLLFMVCHDDDNISGTKVGPSYARCADNVWDRTDMACLCNCKIPTYNSSIVEIRNLNEKGFLPHDEVLDWSCLDGPSATFTDGTSVVCEHGHLKVRASNMADILLNTNNQTVKDSDFCVTEVVVEDPEDEVEVPEDIPDEETNKTIVDYKKNSGKLENSGRFIRVNILVLLMSVVTYTVIMS